MLDLLPMLRAHTLCIFWHLWCQTGRMLNTGHLSGGEAEAWLYTGPELTSWSFVTEFGLMPQMWNTSCYFSEGIFFIVLPMSSKMAVEEFMEYSVCTNECSGRSWCAEQHLLFRKHTVRAPLQSLELTYCQMLLKFTQSLHTLSWSTLVIKLALERHHRKQLW